MTYLDRMESELKDIERLMKDSAKSTGFDFQRMILPRIKAMIKNEDLNFNKWLDHVAVNDFKTWCITLLQNLYNDKMIEYRNEEKTNKRIDMKLLEMELEIFKRKKMKYGKRPE